MSNDLLEISERLAADDEEQRRFAVMSLRRRPFPEVMELLFRAMGDDSWRVRKEAVGVVLQAQPLQAAELEALIALLRSADNAGLRNSAVESLERIGAPAVERLCAHLKDPDHDLRKFIIDILGNIRCATCLPLLVEALGDEDMNVRVAAAENLGKIGDGRALPHLLKVLDGGEVWLKFTVLDALASIGAPVPLAKLEPLLQEGLLRRATYDCLGVLGDLKSFPLLLEGLHDKAKNAREAAAIALMRLRGRLSPPEQEQLVDLPLRELAGTATAKKLIDSLHGEEPVMISALAQLCGIMGDERAALPLVRVARAERLRAVCLEALLRIGEPVMPVVLEHFPFAIATERAIIVHLIAETGRPGSDDLLFAALEDDGPEVRRCAAIALGRLAPEGAAEQVARLLDDEEAQVREGAVDGLQRLAARDSGGVSAVCTGLLRSRDARKRRDAAIILGALADGERLARLVKDEDATVRRAAVASLARVDLPQALGALTLSLSDEEPEVRAAAAQALAERGGDEVLAPLCLALGDEDPWVQTAALKGLTALGNAEALPGVMALLEQAQGPVLIAALSTLAALGGAQALAPVRQALYHSDEEVVEAAIGILAAHGGDWIDEHGPALLEHPHWMVRRSFVRALAQVQGADSLAVLDQALARESDPLVKGEIVELLDRLR
ncbi:HEAT repeat domain-containing protein [Geomonas subterranea]|uniref:HEAT repeat domain-containing protein n=1 Tax=Geomonas subterranea TaxID=2847989 RepID=UPI00296E5F8C|nr:HEAT repeat domain-containing protein [Geomonas fuzhouensis]